MALSGKPLTAKQQTIWDMKQAGKSRPQIAAELGISEPVVSKTITVIRKKLGIETPSPRDSSGRAMENANPEKAAAVLVAATDPMNYKMEKIQEALREAGFNERLRTSVLRRLKVKYAGAVTELRNLQTSEILEMLGKKIHLAMTYLDDKVMAEASARDIMLGLGVLTEKRQLLRGEPTQIISDNERKQIVELMPALLAEAKRRGVTVEGTVTEKVVNPA